MNISFPGLNTCDRRAFELDVDYSFALIKASPQTFAEDLRDRVKICSRLLKKAAGIQQSQALEAVSLSLSFNSWHELSHHLDMAKAIEAGPAGEQWIYRLKRALVLVLRLKPDLPLSREQSSELQSFAARLATVTEQADQVIQDLVAARLYGAQSWEELQLRSPLLTTEPLYGFVVDDLNPNDSRFFTSEACDALIVQMDSLPIGSDEEHERAEVLAWLQKTLEAQPLFFDGGLMLAWMLDEMDDPSARHITEHYLAQANSLIPSDFSEQILWGWNRNRFYHRLQFQLLKILYRDGRTYGELDRAIKIARNLLRLNPNDNLGVRHVLPLLYLRIRRSKSAARACAAFKNEVNVDALLVKSFCSYATGNKSAFSRALISALFKVPALRFYLLDEDDQLTADGNWYRGVVPDLDTLFQFAWPAYVTTDGLENACRSLLADDLVIQAESELKNLWNRLPAGPGSDRSDALNWYDSRVSYWVSTLSTRFSG